MTNILYIASRSDIAGGEVYLLDVFRHLDHSRFTPLVVLPGEGAFKVKLDELGIRCLVVTADYGWLKPPAPWYRFLSDMPQRVRQLEKIIHAENIGLVHTNSNMILDGALAAKLAGVHHVLVVHIPFQANLPVYQRMPIQPATFAQLAGDLSSRLIAVAEPVAASLSPPVSREKIRVIHNGLELQKYADAVSLADGSVRRELGITRDTPLIAAVGRINPDKGFEYFVEAAAKVRQSMPEAHFVIAGAADSPQYEQDLHARIAQAGLSDHMHLLGFRADVPRILAEADVFALTSRTEGGPYVLIEAMACGCACVVTRCGGFVEYVIRHGETGFLVDYGDATSMANHLLELLRDINKRTRFAEAGKALVFSGEFDVRNSVDKLMQVYQEILDEPSPTPGSYAVDLFLQTASEIGYLGEKVTDMEERLKKAERAAQLLLDNPLARFARRIFGKQTK